MSSLSTLLAKFPTLRFPDMETMHFKRGAAMRQPAAAPNSMFVAPVLLAFPGGACMIRADLCAHLTTHMERGQEKWIPVFRPTPL